MIATRRASCWTTSSLPGRVDGVASEEGLPMTIANGVQVASSAVEGVALSTIVVYATTHLGLATGAVGTVLAVAGTAALASGWR